MISVIQKDAIMITLLRFSMSDTEEKDLPGFLTLLDIFYDDLKRFCVNESPHGTRCFCGRFGLEILLRISEDCSHEKYARFEK